MISNIEKLHYYGWNKIQKSIQKLDTKYLIIDCIDNYFNNHTNIIENEWIGIIHHTKSTFSDNNITNLFKNKIFLNSLKNCKCLITLSDYNRNNIISELNIIYLLIPIYTLYHPIPPNIVDIFDINLFEKNLSVINIGGWLRNPYTIYETKIYYNNILLNKHKLKGYLMEQYFPTKDINYKYIINSNSNEDNINYNINSIVNYSHSNNLINYFIKFLIDYINKIKVNLDDSQLLDKLIENHNSVKIYDYLDNEEYIKLFINNIVFCDYIDCSASNTILECILTGTPIILNKLPAIVEYLGDDYPLYRENIYNITNNSYYLNYDNILAAHNYLLNIKYSQKLNLKIFINKFKNIINKLDNSYYINIIIYMYKIKLIKIINFIKNKIQSLNIFILINKFKKYYIN